MNESKDKLKARLIKDYMTQFQSNEERLAELKGLMKGEEADPIAVIKERSFSGKLEMPSPEEIHQSLLKGVTDSIKKTEIPAVSPFSEKVGDNEENKKKIHRDGREG